MSVHVCERECVSVPSHFISYPAGSTSGSLSSSSLPVRFRMACHVAFVPRHAWMDGRSSTTKLRLSTLKCLQSHRLMALLSALLLSRCALHVCIPLCLLACIHVSIFILLSFIFSFILFLNFLHFFIFFFFLKMIS